MVVNMSSKSPDAKLMAKAVADGTFVRIDRRTKWGNPFVVGKDGDRDACCDLYEVWLLTQPELMESISELKGMTLGCWCKPKRCHGDILARLANDKK